MRASDLVTDLGSLLNMFKMIDKDYSAGPNDQLLTNTSSNPIIITMFDTPVFGCVLTVRDGTNSWSENACTIHSKENTHKINGNYEDYTLNMSNAYADFIFASDDIGWISCSSAGADMGLWKMNVRGDLVPIAETGKDLYWTTNIYGDLVPKGGT
jgi:hypothetical protein